MNEGDTSRSTGRIGIDARHAILKLREHRLADPHAYLVELARAAAASGARTLWVEVHGRTLELSHDGHAPSAAELERLVQYIFDAGDDDLHLRLLALAVNGALALTPARIELDISVDGGSARAELDADRLDASDGKLAVHTTAKRLDRSLRVRFTWPLLGRRPGPELELLRDAARDAVVAVVVDGKPLESTVRSLRTSFDAGATRAFVELTPAPTLPHIAFLERGFRLVTVPWRLGALSPLERVVGLRVVVDADELQTNVSRSKLQNSEDLEGRVTVAATAALERLLRGWASEVVEGAPDPGVDNGLGADDASKCLLESCVAALLTGTVVDPAFEGRDRRFDWMLELPLLRDATGAPRRIGDFDAFDEVWISRDVQPAELAWLAERVVLVSERPIERIFSQKRLVRAEDILERGRRGNERRQRHLAHPESRLELFGEEYAMRGAMAETTGPFEGLSAVFGVRAAASAGAGMRCAVHVEGRILQTLSYDESQFPLATDIAIAWPGKLVATIDYDAVLVTQDFWEAIGCVASEVLRRLDQHDPPEILRRAFALTVELQGVATGAALVCPDALSRASIWPTADPERTVSLKALAEYAARTGALCVAEEGATAPDARPLLRADRPETRWLERLVKPQHGLVAYPTLSADREARTRAVEAAARAGVSQGTPGTAVNVGEGCVAYACLAPSGSLIWLHQSLEVQRYAVPGSRIVLAVDDPTLVPAPGWDSALYRRKLVVSDCEGPVLEALLDGLDDVTPSPAPTDDTPAAILRFVLDQMRVVERDARLAQATVKRREEALERSTPRQRKAAQSRLDAARAEALRIEELSRRVAEAEVIPVDADGGTFARTSFAALTVRAETGEAVPIRVSSEPDLAAPGTVVAPTMDDMELLWRRGRFVRALPLPSAVRQHMEPPPLPPVVTSPAVGVATPRARPGFTRPIANAPADCLASREVEFGPFGVGGAFRGRVWIHRQWQPEPALMLHIGASTTTRTLRIASVGPLDPVVPLSGELEVVHAGPIRDLYWMQVAALLMRTAVELVSARDDSRLSWRPYVWHLALLQMLAAPKLRVTALDGRRAGVKAVRTQLQTYRRLWFGRDPSQLRHVGRELCLLDTPSPLLAILDASPSANLVRRLGVDGSFGASAEALLQQTVSLFWPRPDELPQGDAGALCAAIHGALKSLRLAGDPVEHVVATDSGRPVRYRALTRQVVLNTASPLIELVLAEPAKPAHLEAVIAAAVSEINRALSGVTDGEERRALLTRLYALPDSEDRAGLLPNEAARSMLGGPK